MNFGAFNSCAFCGVPQAAISIPAPGIGVGALAGFGAVGGAGLSDLFTPGTAVFAGEEEGVSVITRMW